MRNVRRRGITITLWYAATVVMAARAPTDAIPDRWQLPVRVLHGDSDELFPVSAASAAVERLRSAGVDAAIRVLEGVTHYDTHRFTAPLSQQVAWLRGVCAPPA